MIAMVQMHPAIYTILEIIAVVKSDIIVMAVVVVFVVVVAVAAAAAVAVVVVVIVADINAIVIIGIQGTLRSMTAGIKLYPKPRHSRTSSDSRGTEAGVSKGHGIGFGRSSISCPATTSTSGNVRRYALCRRRSRRF